jgi:hypothetical protein
VTRKVWRRVRGQEESGHENPGSTLLDLPNQGSSQNKKGNKTKLKTIFGITMYPLLGLDPDKILIPSLHCEIDLVNRSNEAQVH